MTRRLAEEHDMRRLEQMEMQQRFDNNEKAGKTDIQELFNKIKREQVYYKVLIRVCLNEIIKH